MNKLFLFASMFFLLSVNGLSVNAQKVKKPVEPDVQKVTGADKLLSAEEKEILEKAVKLEVLKIGEAVNELALDHAENLKLNEKDRFHGYKTVKIADVSESADRQNLIAELFASVGEGSRSRCFFPRHGIRATYKDKTIELLICFECGAVYSFNGKDSKSETIDYPLQDGLNQILGKTQK